MDNKEIFELASMIYEIAKSLNEVKKAAEENPDGLVPNAFFLQNGFSGPSPKTKKNLFMRKVKSFGSTLFSIGGGFAQSTTVVNAADIAKHGASTVSTGVHLYRYRAMAAKVRDGGSLRRHLDVIITLKETKLASRSIQTAVACIPVPGISMVGSAVAYAHSDITEHYMQAVILSTATKLHWQAYRELAIMGGKAGQGPALMIIRELIGVGVKGRFDFGDLHSATVMNEIIKEPAGYLVIQEKLMQT